MRRHLFTGLMRGLTRLDAEPQPIGPDAWVVPRPETAPPDVGQVDEQAWLLQTGRPRLVTRHVGDPELGLHLLSRTGMLRQRSGRVQQAVDNFSSRQHVSWVLRRLRVNCVLDVGANVGQYASHVREQGYRGRIVSFEPLAALAAQLGERAAADPDWLVVPCALGDEEGSAEINARPGTMSSLLPSSDFGRSWKAVLDESHAETVTVRRLASVFDEAVAGIDEPRVFLKLDTQGYDLPALRGAGERLAEVVGLQSEVSCVPIYEGMPRMAEQLTAYEAEGFEITGMFAVSRDPRTMRVIEFDVVMVRPDAVG